MLYFYVTQVYGQRRRTVVERANVQPGIRLDGFHQLSRQQSGGSHRQAQAHQTSELHDIITLVYLPNIIL